MTRQLIRVGEQLRDGKGESIRSAMLKVNTNFASLYAFLSGGSGDALPTAIPVSRGGTGAATASQARQNLGLGDSATRKVGLAEDDVLVVGAFGVGTDYSPNIINYSDVLPDKYKSGELSYMVADKLSAITMASRDSKVKGQFALGDIDAVPQAKLRGSNQGFTQWYTLYGTNNSIVTVNGDIKYSENSVQVHNGKVVPRHTNTHVFKRTAVGKYSISQATIGTEFWKVVAPEGYTAQVVQNGTGIDLTVLKAGDAADIPEGSWVDVNLSK